jgi:putative ABC transport system permease protein
MRWRWPIFRRQEEERRLDLELRLHLEQQVTDNLSSGMTPEEARRNAMIEFGGLDQIKEECRDASGGLWLDTLLQDIRFGLRTLSKSPGFTITALATIGIGIGANAAIFSFVDNVILKPLPYPDPDGIQYLYEVRPDQSWCNISTLNFLEWQRENKVFAYVAGHMWAPATLTGVEQPVLLQGQKVSAHFFDIFGIKTALGRTFVEGEDQMGSDHVAVIANSVWISQFGADPGIIGKSVTLDGEPYTVIGVLAKGNPFERGYFQVWRPLSIAPENLSRDLHTLLAFGRLKPGVTLQQARTQMDAIAISIARDFPRSNKGWGIGIWPLTSGYVGGDTTQSLYLLMAAVGMVLLIACANLANITLARGIAREREVAVRAALGASRTRLVRQLLTESLLLSSCGGVLGLLVGYGGIAAIKAAIPPYWLPMEANVEMDGRVLLFTIGLSALTGLVFGLIPAMRASRPDLTNSIRQGGSGASVGRSRSMLRSSLVIIEVGLASALLCCSGLLFRSFLKLQLVELGFDPTNVVAAGLPVSDKRFPTGERLNLYLHRILDRVGSLPGVQNVALTSSQPLGGEGWGMPFQIVGSKPIDVANRPWCFVKMVSPSYFRTIGMRLAKGRSLTDRDVKGAQPAVVINQTLAKKFFPNDDPIGKQLSIQEIRYASNQFGPEILWQVIGVVADERIQGLSDRNEGMPGIYVTDDQCPQGMQSLVVRGAIAPAVLQRSIANAVHEVDRDQVLDGMRTLEESKSDSLGSDRLRTAVFSIFSAVALLLSAVGLYGVISYSVVQRTREIGIRTALGATSRNILGLVLRNGMMLTGIGLLIGVLGTLSIAQFLSYMLFNVEKYDPITMAAVVGILTVMAFLACIIPARRAAKINSIVALRYE